MASKVHGVVSLKFSYADAVCHNKVDNILSSGNSPSCGRVKAIIGTQKKADLRAANMYTRSSNNPELLVGAKWNNLPIAATTQVERYIFLDIMVMILNHESQLPNSL